MSETAIAASGLTFSYGRLPAVEDVTFSIEKGDFLGIIGPNGGGKTTLLRLLLGLIPPDCGTVSLLGGHPVKTRFRAGYIPQETGLNKSFPITAREVVFMGLTGKRFGRRFTAKDCSRVAIIMEQLGIAQLADNPIGQLSGGQRQKTLLARAMVADPEMLILDEPTASVDTAGTDEIYEHLRQLNNTGVTVVLVTHNIGVLSQYVKSVACINRQLYFHPDGVLDQETVTRTFGCPVDIIAHGVPHRVFNHHTEKQAL